MSTMTGEGKAKVAVAKEKVAKANGSADPLAALQAEAQSLFARRITRLEQVSIQLRHLRREFAQCLIAEKQNKANVYLSSDARSHGEREGQASAQSVSYSTETLLLRGEIEALEEERDFLRFCIEWDAGA